MKKLVLDLDRLSVDSFPTAAPVQEAKGTVHAAGATRAGPTCQTSCYPNGDPACTCPVP